MWTNLVVGAVIGGCVALLLPPLLRRTSISEKNKKTLQSVAVVAAAVIGVQVIAPPLRSQYLMHEFEEQLLSTNVAFAALKKYDPTTYEQLLDRVRKDSKAGKPVGEAQVAARAILTDALIKRLPIAGDSATANYISVMTREIRELYTGGDDACYTFMFPGSGQPFDITKRVSVATMKADNDALAAILESAATSPQPRLNLENYQDKLTAVVQNLYPTYKADLALIDAPQTALEKKRKVCAIVADLYEEILKMPPNEAGKTLRALLAASS